MRKKLMDSAHIASMVIKSFLPFNGFKIPTFPAVASFLKGNVLHTHSLKYRLTEANCILSVNQTMGDLHYCSSSLLLCILFTCQIHLSYASCIDVERQALMNIKESLVDNANRLSTWIGGDCCNWNGITCNNRTGHVEKLDLRNPVEPYTDEFSLDANYLKNCLEGEINPSIIKLEKLQHLDLSSNNFSGSQLPTFLGSLKSMRYLNLSGSGFLGEIPPHLGNLSNLQSLYLGDTIVSLNSFSSKSLKWISGISSLKNLDLSGVNLGECHDWSDSVSMFPSLSSLDLRACRIVGRISPPLSLVNLSSLESLDLGQNQLNSLSLVGLQNLSSLSVLRLDSNMLENPLILSMLESFTSLSMLDLSYNSFDSSSLLSSMCSKISLISVDFSYNQLRGSLPLCLGNLTHLRILNLGKNKFGGKLPSEIGDLGLLTHLDISSNHFNGTIPSSLGGLRDLKYLDLSGNQLQGRVPSTLGLLENLQNLDISNNSLTGEMSESLFRKLPSLKRFSISENYFLTFNVSSQWIPPFQLREILMDSIFIGTQVPPWLRTQKNVAMFSMMNSSISGAIPMWFKDFCSNIKFLYISSNKLNGSLTSIVPPDLHELDLSNNVLTGPIHLYDGNYATNSSLRFLELSNNHLTGTIPDYLCNLSSLGFLSLANNRLTGRIPLCFGNLGRLQVLNLANNSLSGHIPRSIGELSKLIVLHLDRNSFHGVLPSSMKNLKFLLTLDLGENQLMDSVPEWIGEKLSSLQFLRLESNYLYGNIPVHLCQLSSLQVLNLAQNNLVGEIPYCFGNFSMMLLHHEPVFDTFSEYLDKLWNIMKGRELEYSSNLQYLKSISLSGNNLSGEIAKELMQLEGLQSLSLSFNHLSGKIPENIGNLKQLESLDLALNRFTGHIPPTLATIDTLSYLNLSFNNLSGCIPTGNHFQTLSDPSIYEGNTGLRGNPLETSCFDDAPPEENGPDIDKKVDDHQKFEFLWFYAGIAPGFAVAFLGVVCTLHFKKSWRLAYFGFVEKMCVRKFQ